VNSSSGPVANTRPGIFSARTATSAPDVRFRMGDSRPANPAPLSGSVTCSILKRTR